MIDICLSVHDKYGKYSKYVGIVICSLLDNTKSKITFHLIHDETLSVDNKMKFNKLVDEYENAYIVFYKIDTMCFSSVFDRVGAFTIGSLFRLMIPEVIDKSIDKVLYLDADLVINLDIAELYEVNIDSYALAGCCDLGKADSKYFCREGIIPPEKYFNAGVLLMNLKYIRDRYNLLSDSINVLKKIPKCTLLDQDALNYLFFNKALLLDGKYNLFTRFINEDDKFDKKSIFHFSGVKIEYGIDSYPYRLLWYYLKKTPWISSPEILDDCNDTIICYKNAIESYRRLTDFLMEDYKIIVWGAGSVLLNSIMNDKMVMKNIKYFVDSNIDLIGKNVKNIEVKDTSILYEEIHNKIVIIVLSKKYFNEINSNILNMGYEENIIFNGEIMLFR